MELPRVDTWVGLDVGKSAHVAHALDVAGERVFERQVDNTEPAIEKLLDELLEHGTCALVIDQPGSIAALVLALAARRGVPVAYVPGLVMRRASDLYEGNAKTDSRDAWECPRLCVSIVYREGETDGYTYEEDEAGPARGRGGWWGGWVPRGGPNYPIGRGCGLWGGVVG